MNIKGTALISTVNFVKKYFAEQYEEFLFALPEKIHIIFQEGILASNWYPVKEAYIESTITIANLFYNGDVEKAAYELGKFSGFEALKGIYKIFVKIASMDFVLKRLDSIFATYYSEGGLKVEDKGKVKIFKITGFKKDEAIIITRIAGWAEALFTVISKAPSKVEHTYIEVSDLYIEGDIVITWD